MGPFYFMNDKQVTLKRDVVVTGIGLHSGKQAEVRLMPALPGQGITLRRVDGGGVNFGQIRPDLSHPSPLCTLLDDGHGMTISTVEHLLAALHGLKVDCVQIEVDGPEVPILDGSALPWVEAIDRAERVELEAPRHWLRVREPAKVLEDGRVLLAEPHMRRALRIACMIDFPHRRIGRQEWKGVVDEETFRKEIAPARTFTLEAEVEAARKAGLIKGGSLENAVVFGADGMVKNPEGLRFMDEPVRHKVLDAMGDLFLAGQCVWGRFHLTAPGHTANNALLRRIMAAQ
jgi:UDP-3-O-[3-hydroxymyristoyl] N-acetylglucosamine deacetylase